MTHVASFIIEARLPGKAPVWIGTFNYAAGGRAEAVTADAQRLADHRAPDMLREFIAKHLPDGTPEPEILSVRLGSLVFMPGERRI